MFSVVVPLYNKSAEIERCIHSVLAQTYGRFELIVVDDGSTDDSAEKVKRFQDSRVRLVQQPNGGVAEARNRGIREAGDWIAFLDADDTWQPEHLRNLFDIRAKHPEAQFLFTAYSVRRGRLQRRIGLQTSGTTVAVDFLSLPDGKLIPSCTAFTREALLAVGGYREMFGEDVDLWFRVGALYATAYSPRATAVWHLDAANRRCDTEASSTAKYTPGSLLRSLEAIRELTPDTRIHARATEFVRRRERRAILRVLRSGDREHAVDLRNWWVDTFHIQDPWLDRLLTLPLSVHRKTAMLLNRSQSVRSLAGYAAHRLVPDSLQRRGRTRGLPRMGSTDGKRA